MKINISICLITSANRNSSEDINIFPGLDLIISVHHTADINYAIYKQNYFKISNTNKLFA